MLQPSDPSPHAPAPLVVDLDGTLIRTDLIWEHLAALLRRNPLWLLPVLVWWLRGRAFLKRQLARRVKIGPATLPYHEPFLKYLREQKAAGRRIILATASDLHMAKPVADHVGLFDEVLASDGKTNLRRDNKLKALIARFGERGFDYAGNSPDDLVVWAGVRAAIVVNASPAVRNQVVNVATVSASFNEGYSPVAIQKRFLNELFIRSGYLLAMLSGLLLASAFPTLGIAGFAWIAPALMIAAAHDKNSGEVWRVGYLAGLTYNLSSFYWLLLIPVVGFPILGWAALSAFLALFIATWVWLVAGWSERLRSWPGRLLWSLGGAAAWVALEMIRARIFGGLPWNFIGVSQYKITPLIQIAAITGVYGISFLVVWVALSLYCAARAVLTQPTARFAWQAEIVLPFLVVVVVFTAGVVKLRQSPPAASNLRVTLIQPSVPQSLIWDNSGNARRFQQLLTLTETALTNRTDLLIWPEAALPEFSDENYRAITNLIRTHHVWMIFNADHDVMRPGAKDANDYDVYNAAYFFDPAGNFINVYDKQNLVMFGEYIPLAHWLPFLKWFSPIGDGFAAGDKPGRFTLNRWGENPASPDYETIQLGGGSSRSTANIVPLICFEDIFPQLARQDVNPNTDFLVNLTNDGWFGHSAQQWEHLANAVFRTVENDVPLVCCCNNGITGWVDAHGQVRRILRDTGGGVYGPGFMTIKIPLPDERPEPTFYHEHGDWFGWGCVGITVLGLMLTIRRRQHPAN